MILPDTLRQKSREIAYALIRVSHYVKRPDLRAKLEAHAFSLLEATAQGVFNSKDKEAVLTAIKEVSILDLLIRMGHSIYEIEPINATILIRELDAFNSAMRQFGNLDDILPDIESIFTKPSLPIMASEEQEDVDEDHFDDNAAIRQSAIIDLIKSGNEGHCRLKDLIAALPNVSERTLRYDLKKLCEQGALERVGSGGPGSYYRLQGAERNAQKQDSL